MLGLTCNASTGRICAQGQHPEPAASYYSENSFIFPDGEFSSNIHDFNICGFYYEMNRGHREIFGENRTRLALWGMPLKG